MSGRRHHILNVNDNERARYVVTRVLRLAGFDVSESDRGRDAIARVEKASPPIDLLVLDIKMPELDGREVVRLLRANPATAHVKVLHTSATFVSVDNRVHGLEAGADAYLTQPFEPQELVAMVRSLLRLADVEHELRARVHDLADTDRRKDEFLAMLGHELRNPLNVISTSLQVLNMATDEIGQAKRAVELMQRQLDHITRLVDDLLDVSRVTRGDVRVERSALDLREVLDGVVDNARRTSAAGRRQLIEYDSPSLALPVMGDNDRLQQVFANLLDNASKYSPCDSSIRVQVSRQPDWFEVAIIDEGEGMDEQTLHNLFITFYRGKLGDFIPGLGLGLALSKALVEAHGGEIMAHSDGPSRGSTLRVRLPRADLQPAEPRPMASPLYSR